MHTGGALIWSLLLASAPAQARNVRRDASALPAGSASSAKSTAVNMGSLILDGIRETSSTERSTPSSMPSSTRILTRSSTSSSSATAPPMSSPASLSPTASTGDSSDALSCYEALWNWKLRSRSYAYEYGSGPSSCMAIGSWSLPSLYGVSATQLTTLCDGFPRAIGSAEVTVSTGGSTAWYPGCPVEPTLSTPYPTPTPCSINALQCIELQSTVSAVAAAWSESNSGDGSTSSVLGAPPCNTVESETDISWSTISLYGTPHPTPAPGAASTSNCFVNSDTNHTATLRAYASAAQLLYWPVMRANVSTKNYDFCTTGEDNGRYIPWITGTPTASGPNTFVTGSLTITSPDVGIVFTSLALDNYDVGCGTMISETVVRVPVEAVSSQRGARVLFEWWPFDFADLNWVCPSGDSGVWTTQFTSAANCYQDVQALAYFSQQVRWNSYTDYTSALATDPAMSTWLTIANDYHPNVLPSRGYLMPWLSSVFGAPADYAPNGVWDPPSALGIGTAAASAVLPPAGPTTDPAINTPITTPATPAQQSVGHVSPTAPPVVTTTPLPTTGEPTTSTTIQPTQFSFDPAPPSLSSSSSKSASGIAVDSPEGPGAPATSVTQAATTNPQQIQLTVGTSAVTINFTGSDVVVGSNTLGLDSATTVNGQQVSKGSTALVVGTGSAATTIVLNSSPSAQVLTLNSETVTVGQISGNVVVGSQSLTVGGSAQTIGGGVASAGSSVVVIDQGSTTLSVSLASQPSVQQVTINPTTIQISKINTTVIVVGTNPVTIGGSAQTINGQVVSAGSSGLIVGSDSSTTIPLAETEGPADVLTFGSLTMTRSISADGLEILQNAATTVTLSAGGSAFTIGPEIVSAGTDGLEVQMSTKLGTALVSLESQVLTRTQLSGGVQVLSNAHTTLTLSPGGSAVTIGPDQLTAAPSGLVVASNSTSTTIFLAKNGTVTTSSPTSSSALLSITSPAGPRPTTSAKPATTSARLQNAGSRPARLAFSGAWLLVAVWGITLFRL